MKTLYKNSNSPENQNSIDLDYLIDKMKKRDDQQKKTFRRFYIIMIVFVVFYFLLLVINPDPYLTVYKRISGICYVIAFLIGAYLFRLEHKTMTKINYSEPLLDVMKAAVERFRPFKKGFLRFLLVPLFIDLGLTIGGPAQYLPENWSNIEKLVIIQIVYWSIMFIAGLIGFLLWRNRVKPYRDAVKQMVEELDSPVDR
jgi:hypothetical protein